MRHHLDLLALIGESTFGMVEMMAVCQVFGKD
jgi:hypothetical protein